ncbi:T9SS type A sorting domain-containing protein [Pedobacter glucosidilyticus]|uniref:T9SS type A sorting domain-containing protein n=1 Tax=Pedobacter glucosidilyticus TaxID=1122941 RepID=UPI0026ECC11A|nr:T9SS type A sorting domain-containing protein [Pedobacter glucosidilyticus]
MKIKFYKSLLFPAALIALTNSADAQTMVVGATRDISSSNHYSIAVTSAGVLYAGDVGTTKRITKTIAPSVTQTAVINPAGGNPRGLTLSANQSTLYFYTDDGVISSLNLTTEVKTDLVTGQGSDVEDMVLDENGDLIYAKKFTGDILKLNPTTLAITTLINGGYSGSSTNAGDGLTHDNAANTLVTGNISGLAYDKIRKILYIADRTSARIRKIDLNPASPTYKLISTYAGTGTGVDGSPNGLANVTNITNQIWGMDVDGNGNLYFVDRGAGKIKRVDYATGILTVEAGGGSGSVAPITPGSAPTTYNLGTSNPTDVYIFNGGYYIANGNGGNNAFRVNDSTLPVTITGFAAKAVNNAIVVQWKTQEEVTFSRFELLRSTDGTNFSVVDVQAAKGNGSSYSYTDANVALGNTYYYKLNSIDQDGTSALSQPTVASLGGASDDIVVFSNTQDNAININTASAEKLSVKLVNLTGQLIYKGDFSGSNTISTSAYAKGIYVVTITNASGKVIKVQKVVI